MTRAHSDNATSAFYRRKASTYAARGKTPNAEWIDDFIVRMSVPVATVLELGCGSGQDSAYFLKRGHIVHPTDGSPEMAAAATELIGVPVSVLEFGDLEAMEAYDGIWAAACLLHVPRPSLPDVLARIHRALRPKGWLFASFKAGTGEGRDGFGRYYNYPDESMLRSLFSDWARIEITPLDSTGYDDRPTAWLNVLAQRKD